LLIFLYTSEGWDSGGGEGREKRGELRLQLLSELYEEDSLKHCPCKVKSKHVANPSRLPPGS